MRLNIPQALWRDARFLPLLRELERAFQQLEERISRLPFDRTGRVNRTIDLNNNRLANVATPASQYDAVPLSAVRQIIEDIEDEQGAEETAETERTPDGAPPRRDPPGRRRRRVADAIIAALEDAVPTSAPPNIASTGAVGTTSDPPVFALSDHTHGATLPTSAPPNIACTGAVGTTTSPLIFALSNHTHGATVPTSAPPNIASTGAVGTTTSPLVFALSDHTHAAMVPTSAPPAVADTGSVGTTTSPLVFALSDHRHATDCVLTQGQLVGHNGTAKTAIPAPTTNGHVLTADLSLGVRMKWAAPSGGGGGGGLTHPEVMARGVFSGPF